MIRSTFLEEVLPIMLVKLGAKQDAFVRHSHHAVGILRRIMPSASFVDVIDRTSHVEFIVFGPKMSVAILVRAHPDGLEIVFTLIGDVVNFSARHPRHHMLYLNGIGSAQLSQHALDICYMLHNRLLHGRPSAPVSNSSSTMDGDIVWDDVVPGAGTTYEP